MKRSTGVILRAGAPKPINGWSRSPNNPIISPTRFLSEGSGTSLGFNAADPCGFKSVADGLYHVYFSSASTQSNWQSIKHASAPTPKGPWTVDAGYALEHGSTGAWDSITVETACVQEIDFGGGTYIYAMYYSGTGTDNGGDADEYALGFAYSTNVSAGGLGPGSFTKDGTAAGKVLTVSQALATQTSNAVVSGVITDPTFVFDGGVYRLWYYCAGKNSSGSYIAGGVGYSESTNGVSGFTHSGTLSSLAVNGLPQQPTVLKNGSNYEMLFNIDSGKVVNIGYPGLATEGYYKAVSTDRINWTIKTPTGVFEFPWDRSQKCENNGLAVGPGWFIADGMYYLLYPSFSTLTVPANYYQAFTWPTNLATKALGS